MAFLNILVRSVTQFVDMFLVAQESTSLSLTFTKRSLKLNVSVTDLFTSFGYSGINRTNGGNDTPLSVCHGAPPQLCERYKFRLL